MANKNLEEDENKEQEKYDNKVEETTTNEQQNNNSTIKEKLIAFWKNLSIFDKFATIGIASFILLGIIAFLFGKIVSAILAILQIILAVVSLLMKKQIIKNVKEYIPIILMVLSFIIIIPYFSLFKISIKNYEKYEWNDIVLSNIVEQPKSPYGEIISNSNKYLSLHVNNTSKSQFSDYIKACKGKGFNIDIEQTGSSFYAYNEEGYKLSLHYYESDKEMHISIDSPMELGTLKWPESELAKLVPAPKSTIGNIEKDEKTSFVAYVKITSKEDYNAYITACSDNGFNVNSNKTDKQYSAKNENSYKIVIEYIGNNIMKVTIYEPEYDIAVEIKCVENWIFSQYDVKVYIDNSYKGTITHGGAETYDTTLNKGKHKIKFVSAEDDSITGEKTVEISKNENFKFRISCTSHGIDVETLEGTIYKEDNTNENAKNETTNEVATESEKTTGNEPTTEVSQIEAELEKTFPKERAKRAIIVAMTNGTAIDVFKPDGNTYDISKFHKYSDTSDYYLSVKSEGTWTAKDTKTWHVEDMKLEIEAFNIDSALKLNADIVFDGKDYVISKVHYVQGDPRYIESNDPSKLNITDEEAKDSAPYLTVSENLISEDRSGTPTKNKLNESAIIAAAKNTFEKYGKSIYPYGFKCHWIVDLVACEVRDDGSCYIKVGVTIENQYGNKLKTRAEGIVKDSSVTNFYVSN